MADVAPWCHFYSHKASLRAIWFSVVARMYTHSHLAAWHACDQKVSFLYTCGKAEGHALCQVSIQRVWERDSRTVVVRWNLRCFPRILDNVMGTMVNLDGLSEYHFSDAGFVHMHKVRAVLPLTGDSCQGRLESGRWSFLSMHFADACLCTWAQAMLCYATFFTLLLTEAGQYWP